MELDIRPDPPEDVRAAIEDALRLAAERDDARSAWWRAGVEAAVGEEPRRPTW